MEMGKVYLTRFSGKVGLLAEFQSASSSSSIDEYFIKWLIKLGYTVCIHKDQLPTKLIKHYDEYLERYEWLKDIELLDGFMYPDIPDDIDYVFIQQGHENFRFKGSQDLPSQVILYRQLRNCKCPIIYLQYDYALPLFLPAFIRGEICDSIGINLPELLTKRVVSLSAGKYNIGTIYADKTIKFMKNIQPYFMKYDSHSVCKNILIDYKNTNENRNNEIRFIGKDRNKGSRVNALIELANNLDPYGVKLTLNGKWKDNILNTKINYEGILASGAKSVIDAYSKSKYALVMGNDGYKSIGQYTLRVFEVLAAGCIPIIEKSWFETWSDLFSDKVSEYILDNLIFDNYLDIIDIVNKFNNTNPLEVSKILSDDILNRITDDVVLNSIRELLTFADNLEVYNSKEEFINELNSSDSSDKKKEYYISRLNIPYDELKRISISDDTYNNYIFNESTVDKDKLIELFRR